MFKLVEKYADHPAVEWGALFRTILQSRINDWHRRQRIRNRFRVWFGRDREADEFEPAAAEPEFPDGESARPDAQLQSDRRIARLEEALAHLSPRQRQVFLLRCWEGLDVRDTARAMSCSEGSVKTHYSRAVHQLREWLGDYWQ